MWFRRRARSRNCKQPQAIPRRLAAWGTCFDGQLSMLTDPERLDEIEAAVGAAAEKLAELEDAAGEAKAHTVRAGCLARLGRIGDCETALDQALTAARRAREHRRVNAVLAGAPLAALWGPNPVPRAGGRCLDVVRLLRITTGSPVVEATSTRCQGVLDAFRGRAAAGRQLIDSARRTLTELGMRHALLEVDQFAGIVELVADDPAAAEPHLRRAYDGFRRMGLDADTAETAALLARACLALDRDAEADELCTESERLAGHALKASIAWRTVRAQLLARSGDHDEARRVAEEAVAIAERTDALVDHGDACLALATVLDAAGDAVGARAAAERGRRPVRAERCCGTCREGARHSRQRDRPLPPAPPENADGGTRERVRASAAPVDAAIDREAWSEVEQLSRTRRLDREPPEDRRLRADRSPVRANGQAEHRRFVEMGMARHRRVVVAVRGERLALTRAEVGTADVSPGRPRTRCCSYSASTTEGRIALQVWFDVEDIDAAMAELDAAHARFEERRPRRQLENAASRADDRIIALSPTAAGTRSAQCSPTTSASRTGGEDCADESNDRAAEVAEVQAIAEVGVKSMTSTSSRSAGSASPSVRTRYLGRDQPPDAFDTELCASSRSTPTKGSWRSSRSTPTTSTPPSRNSTRAISPAKRRPRAHVVGHTRHAYAELNRHELTAIEPDWVNIDHRRLARFASGDLAAARRVGAQSGCASTCEAVHASSDLGAVVSLVVEGTSQEGFDAEWRVIVLHDV